MNILNRGSRSLIDEIRKGARQVSEANGIAELGNSSTQAPVMETQISQQTPISTPPTPPVQSHLSSLGVRPKDNSDIVNQLNALIGGSAASSSTPQPTSLEEISVPKSTVNTVGGNTGNIKFDFMKSSFDRLVSDVELLSSTGSYFNALQSMISLYAMDSLDDKVLDKVSRSDLNEIRGILREFKGILDSY